MNRILKKATVRTLPLPPSRSAPTIPGAFLNTHNFAKYLKTLSSFTPFQFICSSFQKNSSFLIQAYFLPRETNS